MPRYDEAALFELKCPVCKLGISVFPGLTGAVAAHLSGRTHTDARKKAQVARAKLAKAA